MSHATILRILLPVLAGMLLWNCAPSARLASDYSQRKPKVVLVPPPENLTAADDVEEMIYPIVYEKMSNRGYYCLSPELVKRVFTANKLEDAGRIHALPPAKFKEIFGADAVLLVRVLDWHSKYYVISSKVTVTLEMRLVDAASGDELWSLTHTVSKSPSNNSGGGLTGALLNAALHAAFTPYEPIADENARVMLGTLPKGARAQQVEPSW